MIPNHLPQLVEITYLDRSDIYIYIYRHRALCSNLVVIMSRAEEITSPTNSTVSSDANFKISPSSSFTSNRQYPWTIYQYTLIVCSSCLAGGYSVASISPTILYIPHFIPLTTFETTLVVSIVLIGALLGTFISGAIGDKLGRNPVLVMGAICGLIASIILTLAENPWELIVGRTVVGLAVGAVTVVSGLFLAETAPTHIRGRLQGYGHLAGWIGGILAHFIGIGSHYVLPVGINWRFTFAFGGLIYFVTIFLQFLLLPESPRWLISKGRDREALATMKKIYGKDKNNDVESEYQSMRNGILSCSNCKSIKELFRKEYRRPLILSFALQALQQLSGNNMITFYSSIILHDLGFSKEMSVFLTGLSIVPQAFIVWAVVHALDRIGRRIPLLVSVVGSGLSLVVMASVLHSNSLHVSTWFSLSGILLNRIFFSVGLGPLPAVVAAEILPFNVRGKGLAAAIAMGEIFKIVSVFSFLPLIQFIHPSLIYGSLAASMFLGFIYLVSTLSETKGTHMDAIHIKPSSPISRLQHHPEVSEAAP